MCGRSGNSDKKGERDLFLFSFLSPFHPQRTTVQIFVLFIWHESTAFPSSSPTLFYSGFFCCYFIPGTLASVSIKRNIFFLPCVDCATFFCPCRASLLLVVYLYLFSLPLSLCSLFLCLGCSRSHYYYFAEVGSLR